MSSGLRPSSESSGLLLHSHSTERFLRPPPIFKPTPPKRTASFDTLFVCRSHSPFVPLQSPRPLSVRVNAGLSPISPASGRSHASVSSPQFAGAPLNITLCRTPDERAGQNTGDRKKKFDENLKNQKYDDKLLACFTKSFSNQSFLPFGQPVSKQDLELAEVAKKSLELARTKEFNHIRDFLGITRLVRGTYFIQDARLAIDHLPIIEALQECYKTAQILKPIFHYLVGEHFIAVFKPVDEARGMPNCRDPKKILGEVLPGQYGIAPDMDCANQNIARGLHPEIGYSVLEIELEDDHFYQVGVSPETVLTKRGSLQAFIPNTLSMKDLSCEQTNAALADVPLDRLQQIFFLDLRLVNTDRNAGNLLYNTKIKQTFPIDHALILPARFQTASELAWIAWDQARLPFSPQILETIAHLDFEKDKERILSTAPNYPLESLETMRIAYALLQIAAQAGLTPFQIACFYTGKPISPMMSLYANTREKTDDPEKLFQIITDRLKTAVTDLKSRYAQLETTSHEDCVRTRLYPYYQHLQWNLCKTLHTIILS